MTLFIALLVALFGVSAWIYAVAVKGGESRVAAAGLAVAGGPIITATLLWIGMSVWGHFRDRTGGIPVELEIAEQVFADESGGIREGCGLFVFRLTEASRLDLVARGMTKIKNARTGREKASYHQYGEWRVMPTDFYIRGHSCVDLPGNVSKIIDSAWKTAYVTQGYEFDLLVDPVSGVVVYSYSG